MSEITDHLDLTDEDGDKLLLGEFSGQGGPILCLRVCERGQRCGMYLDDDRARQLRDKLTELLDGVEP